MIAGAGKFASKASAKSQKMGSHKGFDGIEIMSSTSRETLFKTEVSGAVVILRNTSISSNSGYIEKIEPEPSIQSDKFVQTLQKRVQTTEDGHINVTGSTSLEIVEKWETFEVCIGDCNISSDIHEYVGVSVKYSETIHESVEGALEGALSYLILKKVPKLTASIKAACKNAFGSAAVGGLIGPIDLIDRRSTHGFFEKDRLWFNPVVEYGMGTGWKNDHTDLPWAHQEFPGHF